MNNRYEVKMAVKDGPCDLCFRATQSVLTSGPTDWFFLCRPHLLEPLFCKAERPSSPPVPPTPTPIIPPTEEKKGEESSLKTQNVAPEIPEPPPPRWYILDPKIFG